jgi:hypothetical protein
MMMMMKMDDSAWLRMTTKAQRIDDRRCRLSRCDGLTTMLTDEGM